MSNTYGPAEWRLFADVRHVIDLWDAMSSSERDRMPDEMWDHIDDLRRVLDEAG